MINAHSTHPKGLKAGFRTLLFWLFPASLLILFFFYPLAAILRLVAKMIFSTGLEANILAAIWRPLGFTIWQAVISTILTLLFGLPAAFIFARFQFPGKSLLRILTTLPFILPTVVVAASFNALLGANGWLNIFLMRIFHTDIPPIHVLNSFAAILLAHVFYNTTIIIRIVGSALEQLDPRLEQAARMLGATPRRAIFEITLPLLRLPIIAAVLLVFLFDFTSFGVILLLGGPGLATLEVEIYIQALYMLNLPLAGVISLIQLFCTLIITLLYQRISGKAIIPLMPRLRGEGLQDIKTWGQRLMAGFLVCMLVLLLIAPLGALVLRSFTRFEAERGERGEVQTGMTTDYYRELLLNRRGSFFYVPPILAIRNSLVYGGITVVLSLVCGFFAAYALAAPTKWNRWLDAVLMLPLGTSAVTLGLGYITVFNRPPLEVGSFPWLVPIAHTLVALPLVVRTLLPAVRSIPTSLQQAANVLGASPWQVWREVDLPILFRAASVAMIFSFTISLGEFGATSFIARPEYPTLPLAIFRFLSQPGALNYGQALAMATILLAVCGLSIFLLEKLQVHG